MLICNEILELGHSVKWLDGMTFYFHRCQQPLVSLRHTDFGDPNFRFDYAEDKLAELGHLFLFGELAYGHGLVHYLCIDDRTDDLVAVNLEEFVTSPVFRYFVNSSSAQFIDSFRYLRNYFECEGDAIAAPIDCDMVVLRLCEIDSKVSRHDFWGELSCDLIESFPFVGRNSREQGDV